MAWGEFWTVLDFEEDDEEVKHFGFIGTSVYRPLEDDTHISPRINDSIGLL
jgi:hypothetical protein